MKQNNKKQGKDYKDILDFVDNAKNGVYSQEKPIVLDYSIQRINIPEQSRSLNYEDYQESYYLFGITS